jgi:prepilin-type N-terminal cleavage/methylation domain-containing protein
MFQKAKRNAFTLIEVLIVVVIMAVLAATIIPQFASSTDDAKSSALQFNLHTMRQQLEMYKLQHGSTYPAIGSNTLPGLIYSTASDGTQNGSLASSTTYPFGPYVQGGNLPANPFVADPTIANKVVAGTTFPPTSTSSAGGWYYNATTGQLAPAYPQAHLAD